MNLATQIFDEAKKEFTDKGKLIHIYKTQKRTLPSKEKITSDTNNFINAYNNLARAAEVLYPYQEESNKNKFIVTFENVFKPRLSTVLSAYNLKVQRPNNFDIIDKSTLATRTTEDEDIDRADDERIQKVVENLQQDLREHLNLSQPSTSNANTNTENTENTENTANSEYLDATSNSNVNNSHSSEDEVDLNNYSIVEAQVHSTPTRNENDNENDNIDVTIRPIVQDMNDDNANQGINADNLNGQANQAIQPMQANQANQANQQQNQVNQGIPVNQVNHLDPNLPNPPNPPDLNQNAPDQANTMPPQTKSDFLKSAASILNYKFNGDFEKLETFLDDVDIVEGLVEAGSAEIAALCLKFVKSKCEGKAKEVLPDKIETVKDITDALTKHIAADSSKVIEGKMIALRVRRGDFSKFQEEAEKIAEQYRRSLRAEKITKDKANEMTVTKLQDICRRNAYSDVVKSVISSSHFTTPKEVIAKFITESDTVRQEKASNNSSNRNNFPKKFNRQSNDNRNKNFNKNGNKSYSESSRNGQNSNRNSRNYSNSNKRNDFHRGKNPKNEHTIRVVTQNSSSRQHDDNDDAPNETFFRIPSK